MILSIVIVNWNTKELVSDCLHSVFNSAEELNKIYGDNCMEIIVTDNGSVDSSRELLKKFESRIKLIQNDSNLGYAFASNQGMKEASGKYVLLLGSDTVINSKALKICVDHLDSNPKTGAAACQLIYPDGSLQNNVKKFPKLKNAFFTYLSLDKFNKDYDMAWFDYKSDIEVDQIATTFLMIRNSLLKEINYFDTKYRILYNDVDLCRKIKNKGYDIMFLSGASVIHHGSQSTKQANFRIREIMYKDIFRFYKKNFGFKAVFLVPILYFRLMAIKFVK